MKNSSDVNDLYLVRNCHHMFRFVVAMGFFATSCMSFVGCSNNAQSGKYVVTSREAYFSDSGLSCLVVVYGKSRSSKQPSKLPRPLVYLLFVTSEVHGDSGTQSVSGKNAKKESTIEVAWTGETIDVRIQALWDRENDEIVIGGFHYFRNSGNVFVVLRNENAELTSYQVSDVPEASMAKDVIIHIKKQLDDVSGLDEISF